MRHPPTFWGESGAGIFFPTLLSPFSLLYRAGGAMRRLGATPYHSTLPVICVGNLTVGGTGKTPVTQAIAKRLQEWGLKPHILSRGYGGRLTGPVTVEMGRHSWQEVGDEPLLLSHTAPVTIARDRAAGARHIERTRADLILMDDGFQNPTLRKDLSLLLVDAEFGFGNGRILPAGPLRESIAAGLRRADAVVLMGTGSVPKTVQKSGLPILMARLVPDCRNLLKGQPVVGFAGIGHPEKFQKTLQELGGEVVKFYPFPDHHPYREQELATLQQVATEQKAQLVTTEKDGVRLPTSFHRKVATIPVSMLWEHPVQLDILLQTVIR